MNEFLTAWKISVLETLKDYFIFAGIAFLIFYVLFKGYFSGRKVQKKFPAFSDHGRDILYSLISMVIFGVVGALVFGVLMDKTQIYFEVSDHGVVYFMISIPVVIFVHDTYFYWTHRFMHLPRMFKLFHKTHHLSHNPTPWTAYAFNPLEALVEACITPVIAFSFPVHIHVILGFFIFQIFFNVYGHLGFELYPKGFHKTRIGRWLNTSVGHNMHHKYFRNNYGLYFLFWDRVMNTLDSRYDEQFEAATSGKTKTMHTADLEFDKRSS